MTLRDVGRKRLMLALALALPLVFFAVVFATAGDQTITVQLAAAGATSTAVSDRRLALLFISLAAAALISAFVAASLVQRQAAASRRLVLCGYRPAELLAARLLVLGMVVAIAAIYTWVLLSAISRPVYPAAVSAGIGLVAFVYGCYGLLVGSVLRRELETVFALLVLINIDAGWLQNPIYYATARSPHLIEALPAHFPSQAAYLAAFTHDGIGALALGSLAYGIVLLVAALVVYTLRMRVAR